MGLSAEMRWRIAAVVLMAASCAWAQTQTYTESVLYSFCSEGGSSCTDGVAPTGIVQGTDGNLYGLALQAGAGYSNNCNSPLVTGACGTVFKITPSGTYTVLHSFCAQGSFLNCPDGFAPEGSLIQASDGNFYGITSAGGSGPAANCVASVNSAAFGMIEVGGCGTVFKITPSGSLTTLYSFCTQAGTACPDGFNPDAGVVEGSDGNFYGTTSYGGANGEGTVFKLTPSGVLTTLYSFCSQSTGDTSVPTNCIDGANPGGLTLGTDGNFYGTTQNGGTFNLGSRWGTIFKITPAGALTVLYSFCTPDCSSGFGPGNLVEGVDGNFYGFTSFYGAGSGGTIFQMTPAGVFTVIYPLCLLANCADGNFPDDLLQASDGNFYGVTLAGGANNEGTVFTVAVTGSSGFLTTLYSFCTQGGSNCTDGESPGAIIQSTDGNFYGASFGGANDDGALFKLAVSPAEPIATFGTAANGATYISGGLVPGSWAQIKGTDLSSTTRIWDAADFAGLGNNLPTKLSGIQVMVNNIAAPVYYISPGQISFQVPSGVSGNASVEVINNGVTSNSLTASAATSSPGIFPVIENGVNYPAGVFLDGEYVGDPSVQGFRNAKPGDVIQLYATGLASSPAGVIPSQQTLNGVTVTIGSTVIPADFAGLVAAGEFQINFTIPQSFANQPAGSYPISVQLAGVSSPTTINTSPPEQIVIPIQPQ